MIKTKSPLNDISNYFCYFARSYFGVVFILAFLLFPAKNVLGAEASHNTQKSLDFNYNKKIYGTNQIEAIKNWGLHSPTSGVVSGPVTQMNGLNISVLNNGEKITGIRGIKGLGESFTILQHRFFAPIFLAVIILTIAVFFGHHKIIGSLKFDHHSKKFKVFSKYNIIVHWGSAIPFIIICLTGLAMVFGDKLGGGTPIRVAKNIHFFATFVFLVFGVLMFLMWVRASMFKLYDIEWFKIMGGYLSKNQNSIPAGKFNAGQKMWFWIATIGGFLMGATGLVMHYFYGDINFLRLSAIIHNVLGFGVIAMLITHIYMSVFAIEGALESILNGEMGEEELAIMHSFYYKELMNES
ncbi:formate dehydrogenase subunit gamma [Helicobacter cappadocius]|uniref:Formate dehydrogenase subunit gamma n=1 Tax=Helicobacter cappadocius TaxID=3063998 RepID=A0AA90PUQ9_9HELI|nr:MULTISPECIES: formate dehydrogenase subunit gamma [unclassified Helicobacter]MDO7252887.1 formate dehydrogenase subunit gamma [Helicobacter sp. faydin-H75]MDP2538930.1 formate dehydrogenase subunit gamma [Helicobacter sp. faydin-H76]